MASLPGLGNSLDSRAERRSWARLSGCGVWSWAMVFSGIGCLQLGGCENHAVGPRLPPALQGTAPAVQAVCAIVGAGSLEHLRLRLRYERLRGAGRQSLEHLRLRLRYECLRAAVRQSLEHLRLRLRYERLRAAGRQSLEHLRLRLGYECLRAAVRHSCPFPLRGMAGLLQGQVQVQVCGGPLRKTHEKPRKKANPWRAAHVIAAYLSCPSIAAFFRPLPVPNRLAKPAAPRCPAHHPQGICMGGPGGRGAVLNNDQFFQLPTHFCMRVPAAPSELRQALAKLTPFFWRAFVFATIGGLLVLGPTVYMFEVYDRVVNSRNELTLAMLTLIVLLAIVVMELLEWARAETLREAGAALDQALAPRIFNAIHVAHLKQGAALGVQPMVDLRVVRDFFHGPALGAAMEAPVGLILLILLFVIHPLLGWVALAGAVLQTGVSWLNERSTSPVMLEANRSDMGAKTYVDGTLRHSDVVAALGMEQDMRRRWLRLYDEGLGLQSRASDRAAVFQSIGKFFQTTLASALLGLGAWLLLRNQLPGGPGMMIVGSVLGGRVLAPLVQVVSQWRAVIQLRGAWERLGQLLERQPAPTPNMPLPRPQARVAVENLVAGASAGAAPFIKGLSFQLTPGEVLGVLGSSACGKTTLARILMGLWPPLAGSVRLDGVDVSIWDKAELGPHVGYVPQEVDLIDGTLGENIVRFGAIDGQAMYDAAQVVGLHAWITSLPLGYDTPVGEAGVMLSGGQRQRVALARAFYGSPVFVVLDEPNASLDEAGNIALAEALRTFKARGTTIVVMTHLQSVLAGTDKLLVLHAGMQQAFGPRDEVLAMLQGRSAAVASAASTGSVVTVEAQAS